MVGARITFAISAVVHVVTVDRLLYDAITGVLKLFNGKESVNAKEITAFTRLFFCLAYVFFTSRGFWFRYMFLELVWW